MTVRDTEKENIYTPLRLFITLALVIFIAEAIIMVGFHFIQISSYMEIFLDPTILVLILYPFIYYFIFHPMAYQFSKTKRSEKELREKVEELERFRKATIQREFRIKELTDEIKDLRLKIQGLEKG